MLSVCRYIRIDVKVYIRINTCKSVIQLRDSFAANAYALLLLEREIDTNAIYPNQRINGNSNDESIIVKKNRKRRCKSRQSVQVWPALYLCFFYDTFRTMVPGSKHASVRLNRCPLTVRSLHPILNLDQRAPVVEKKRNAGGGGDLRIGRTGGGKEPEGGGG